MQNKLDTWLKENKPKSKRIDFVPIAGDGSKMESVSAWDYDGLIIHKDSGGYAISHKNTGGLILKRLALKSIAVSAVSILKNGDWGGNTMKSCQKNKPLVNACGHYFVNHSREHISTILDILGIES